MSKGFKLTSKGTNLFAQAETAKQRLTALELTEALDKLKAQHGSIDEEALINLIKQLREFGPYYKGVLKIIVDNL